MISTANSNKNNVISIIAAVVLGAAVFGLQGCGGGGDGTPAVVPDVTLSSASVTEGNSGTTNLDFTVILSQATTTNVTVSYSTSDGTALAGQDYTATTGTLAVPAGVTSATITVPVTGDEVTEADETFSLQINNAVNGAIANNSVTVTGSIINDDPAGYYTGSATVNEAPSSLVIDDPDLQVIVADDRLVLINLANNLIYVAPMTSVTSNSFSTTARIYKNGDFTTTTDITATFIAGASITLTLTGTGDYTTGSMSLAYSAKNAVAPLVLVGGSFWQDTPFTANLAIVSSNSTNIITSTNVPSTSISGCDTSSAADLINVVSEQTGRLRSFTGTGLTSCADFSLIGTSLDGYFTTFDNTLPDDRILFVWFNDEGAHAASLTKL